MSKSSNYNLLRLFIDKNVKPSDVINQLINKNVQSRYKIIKCFKFNLGRWNDLQRKQPVNQYQLLTFNISKSRRFQQNGHTVKDKVELYKKIGRFQPQFYKIFRKKDYNTLYQVNTVPRIIRLQNGKYDKDYVIDWSLFQNMILLSDKHNPDKLKLYKVFFEGFAYINQEEK